MKALAQETGARAFFPTQLDELAGVYASIAQELATQYTIGYASKNPKADGAYRRVIVRIADKPGIRTRTRAGYTAPRVPAHRIVVRDALRAGGPEGPLYVETRMGGCLRPPSLSFAFAWLALLLASPFGPIPLAALTYGIGGFICHRMPERSFHLGGLQSPVCARCLGIYAGAALAAGAYVDDAASRWANRPLTSLDAQADVRPRRAAKHSDLRVGVERCVARNEHGPRCRGCGPWDRRARS